MKKGFVTNALFIAALFLAACGGCKSLSPGGVYRQGRRIIISIDKAVLRRFR
jgi:hypothetical protein